MYRTVSTAASLLIVLGLSVMATPAAADHTDPTKPLAPTDGVVEQGISRGEGTWEHLANFPGTAGPQLTGGGTDLEFFKPAGSDDIWGSFGTLGQDEVGSVGQRLIRLTRNGHVRPSWQADFGSAHCAPASTSVTGLQHDTQVAQRNGATLLTDTTDATGRCHDPNGGGIEIVDATNVAKPREVHLVRFPGFTHTNTVDGNRPWIVYSSSSDFADRNWIDVVNMRSCFGDKRSTTGDRRRQCRPEVSRIQFQDAWTQQRDQTTGELEPGSATCHDITYKRNRLYCAGVNATLILDVSNLVGSGGDVRGETLPCPVVDGTRTTAKVTDCSGMGRERSERATGWRFLGTYQHPGRDCGPPGTDVRNCNSNNQVRSDEGVSVSHEADPTPDERFMFVTDERGGGVVPPGSSCSPGIENPYGNGGAHAFDISDPSDIEYATTPTGEKAVYISDAVVPAATFCDIHVIEQIPGEQRFIAAYYTQGIKVVDYFVDDAGHIQFVERASFTLPRANTWAAEDFKIRDHADGTRTYFLAVDDIHRGIDVVSWRGAPNPMGAEPPRSSENLTNAGLAGASAVLLVAAALYRRRRQHADR
ncbi:MAG TPA: hypothetical protein VFY58_08450 [Nocardioides sp.]|nr:hypothetical protein [Nocardioides sp.]